VTTVIGSAPNKNMHQNTTVLVCAPPKQFLDLPAHFPIALDKGQMKQVIALLDNVNFLAMPQQDIASLCGEVEKEFNTVLDGFLERINDIDNPKLTKILKTLSTAVEEQDLQGLANRILNEKPNSWDKLKNKMMGLVRGVKDSDTREQFWEETKDMLRAKSTNLKTVVTDMEKELDKELIKLNDSVAFMDEATDAYKAHFENYVIAVAFMSLFYNKAQAQVEDFKLSLDDNNLIHQRQYNELDDKLQKLESRTLALEGTLTSIPADDLVIRQLQNANVSARQDAMTTLPARFTNIKMTILKLNSALILQGMQNVADHSKRLDDALSAVTSQLTKEVVTHAANAPGEARKAQAEQILGIITDTKELLQIAEKGRENNKKNFADARKLFADARQAMLHINTTH